MAASKRVRVQVKYGESNVTYSRQDSYTYLVPPEKAQVGQTLTVPVNNGNGIYYTRATVVDVDNTTLSQQIRHPRRGE